MAKPIRRILKNGRNAYVYRCEMCGSDVIRYVQNTHMKMLCDKCRPIHFQHVREVSRKSHDLNTTFSVLSDFVLWCKEQNYDISKLARDYKVSIIDKFCTEDNDYANFRDIL